MIVTLMKSISGEKNLLVNSSLQIDGAIPKLPDDVDVDNDGNIYWSDASTHTTLDTGFLDLLSSPSGRLLKYDPKTKKNEVLMKDIHFANGVQLSPDASFVLVNECFRLRVHRYWLKGPKKGKSEVFIAGLPGMPDNIRARPEGGYYVSIITSDPMGHKSLRIFTHLPRVRLAFARFVTLIRNGIELINSLLDLEFLHWLHYRTFNLVTYNGIGNHTIAVVVVGEDGNILDSYQGSGQKITRISQASAVGNSLFLGSPYNDYLARIPLHDLEEAKYNSNIKPDTSKDEL